MGAETGHIENTDKPERVKNANMHQFFLEKILTMGIMRGYSLYDLQRNVQIQKDRRDGSKLVITKPLALIRIDSEDAGIVNGHEYLLHNTNPEWKFSYHIGIAKVNGPDSETSDHVVISRVLSPNGFLNKEAWLKGQIGNTVSPEIYLSDFQGSEAREPEIFISMMGEEVAIAYNGGRDQFLEAIYNQFPDRSRVE